MEKVKKMNYQKELEKLIVKLEKEEKVPRLLLHSCCAPCSSYVLEYLSNYFDITVFYYNPNIFPESEYTKRILEQQMLIGDTERKSIQSLLLRAIMTGRSFMSSQKAWNT